MKYLPSDGTLRLARFTDAAELSAFLESTRTSRMVARYLGQKEAPGEILAVLAEYPTEVDALRAAEQARWAANLAESRYVKTFRNRKHSSV